MTMATVSPNLNNSHNFVGILKKRRILDSNQSEISALIEKAKRRKKIDASSLGISEEARLADYEKSRSSGVRFGYVQKGLMLNDDVIYQLRNENTNNLLLNHKKLHLVLDLDHTLLNTTFLDNLSPEEEYLKTETLTDHSLQHVHIVDTPTMLTKFRPDVRKFLVEASQMFELSIYTMGSRDYALEASKLLDPENQIFGGRVISRSDGRCADRKELDVLLALESAVVILDDTKDVWKNNNQDNVIVMPRYHFFKSSYQKYGISNIKPYSELKTDEYDLHGGAYLANVLQLLKHVHTIFFNEVELQGWNLIDRDVRLVLKLLQKEVLKGCKIVFSHVFPSDVKADTNPLWKMAEQLGATCSTQVDPSVTHVVAADVRTHKSFWAVKEGKFLVNPQWIETAHFMWQKQPEENFPCHDSILPTLCRNTNQFPVSTIEHKEKELKDQYFPCHVSLPTLKRYKNQFPVPKIEHKGIELQDQHFWNQKLDAKDMGNFAKFVTQFCYEFNSNRTVQQKLLVTHDHPASQALRNGHCK